MKFCTLSDLHCLPDRLDLQEVLKNFLRNPIVQDCQAIFFLGDIFDVMVGDHNEYLNIYSFFFKELEILAKRGVAIHYFEGNHDFHIKKLFKNFSKKIGVKNITVHSDHLLKVIDGKKIYFSHGDDIEIGKLKYKSYKLFIKSLPLNFVADYCVPYEVLDFMGNFASQNSKKRNHIRYSDPEFCEEVRSIFRCSASRAWKKHHFDYLICGHAHIADIWKSPDGFTYANAGACFLVNQFIVYEKGKIEIVKF